MLSPGCDVAVVPKISPAATIAYTGSSQSKIPSGMDLPCPWGFFTTFWDVFTLHAFGGAGKFREHSGQAGGI